MTQKHDQLWTHFYNEEQQYLDWLEKHSDPIYRGGEPSIRYREVQFGTAVFHRPQKYIRHILVPHNLELAKEKMASVITAYEAALTNDSKEVKYPGRFPTFLSNVERINVSIKDAWSSQRLTDKPTMTLIKRYILSEQSEVEMANADLNKLLNNGFSSAALEKLELLDECHLLVSESDVVSFFELDAVQKRLHTGSNYTARVTFDDERVETYSLNLLLVESEVPVFAAQPRKKRTDAYHLNEALKLPIDTPYYFFEPKQRSLIS